MRHGYILAIWGGTIQKVAARDTRYLPVTFKISTKYESISILGRETKVLRRN
jgi:hypothetical protein